MIAASSVWGHIWGHNRKYEKIDRLFMRVSGRCSIVPAPPILKPQPFSVGVFSCLITPVPAYSCGFLRTPADFTSRRNWPFRATFHSLLAIPRSGLALRNRPEVGKVRDHTYYRSMGYARTNQVVGMLHWLPKWVKRPWRNANRLTVRSVRSAQTVSVQQAWQWRLAPEQADQDLPRHDLRHGLDRRHHRRSPNRPR